MVFGVERARVHQHYRRGVGPAELRHALDENGRLVLRALVAVDDGLDVGFGLREREHAVAEAVEVGRAFGLPPFGVRGARVRQVTGSLVPRIIAAIFDKYVKGG